MLLSITMAAQAIATAVTPMVIAGQLCRRKCLMPEFLVPDA
jgi:hypothetical protein